MIDLYFAFYGFFHLMVKHHFELFTPSYQDTFVGFDGFTIDYDVQVWIVPFIEKLIEGGL